MKRMILITAATLIFGASPAFAEYKQFCKAELYIISKSALPNGHKNSTLRIDEFEAHASAVLLRNAGKKASEKALRCAKAAREVRWEHRKPDLCKASAGVYGYNTESIKREVEYLGCFLTAGQTYEVHLQVSGGKGCGGHHNIMDYKITPKLCRNVRQMERGIDRPGADYASFDLSKFTPEQCQAECNRDSKCKAWTYVEAQAGKNPRCWLKTAAPGRRQSTCCTSGVRGVEGDTDRPGSDYRSFIVENGDIATCQATCQKEKKCRAWSFVGKTAQKVDDSGKIILTDEPGECWLKSAVPKPVYNKRVKSGVK